MRPTRSPQPFQLPLILGSSQPLATIPDAQRSKAIRLVAAMLLQAAQPRDPQKSIEEAADEDR